MLTILIIIFVLILILIAFLFGFTVGLGVGVFTYDDSLEAVTEYNNKLVKLKTDTKDFISTYMRDNVIKQLKKYSNKHNK